MKTPFIRLHVLTVLAGSLTLFGCAGAASAARFDSQDCAEDSLRRNPDPALVVQVVPQLTSECAAGAARACSILGVMLELGLGVRPARDRARALYRGACDSGNTRACGNLGEILLDGRETGQDPAAGVTLLKTSCSAGHARACAVLGDVLAASRADLATAAALFERACARDYAPACRSLAELVERGDIAGTRQGAADLLSRACVGGDEEGCVRLGYRALLVHSPSSFADAAMLSSRGGGSPSATTAHKEVRRGAMDVTASQEAQNDHPWAR